MLYLPLRFRTDFFIRVEVTGYDSAQCKPWGCGKIGTLQITELIAALLNLLNPFTRFHTEITPISNLQRDYESF